MIFVVEVVVVVKVVNASVEAVVVVVAVVVNLNVVAVDDVLVVLGSMGVVEVVSSVSMVYVVVKFGKVVISVFVVSRLL